MKKIKFFTIYILPIIALVWGIYSYENNKPEVKQNNVNGDNVSGDKITYYNGIPTPEIKLQKITSNTLIEGLLYHGQYANEFILEVDSFHQIPEFYLKTKDGTKVLWSINKELNPGSHFSTIGSELSDSYKMVNVQGKYVISIITPKPNEIDIDYK